MEESHVFRLFVLIYSFWEFASLSACDPQSCVCTCTVAYYLHATKNALNPVMVLTGGDDVTVVLAHSAVTFYWPILISAFTDDLPLCARWLWHILDNFATILPHYRLHTHNFDTWYLSSRKNKQLAKLVSLLSRCMHCGQGQIGLPIWL